MQEFLNKIERELKIRKYSSKTIKSYIRNIHKYFEFKKEEIEKYSEDNIKDFLLKESERNISASLLNQYINSILFFYREIIGVQSKITIKFAKKPQKLPIILTREEIQKIIEVVGNSKHKLILQFSYGAGLRISEVVHVKVQDLDLSTLHLHIKNSKGAKDRITVIPQKLLNSTHHKLFTQIAHC